MTVIEAIGEAEKIIGTIPVAGRESVRKINAVFELLDASIAALTNQQKNDSAKGEDNGTV
jgi:hypothetical protein